MFANGRQAVANAQNGGFEKTGIELFSEGGAIEASIKGWKIRSIY